MVVFENLDTWILNTTEKFSHWWQKLTGLDCFWCAHYSLIVCTGFMMGLGYMSWYSVEIFVEDDYVEVLTKIMILGLVLALVFYAWKMSRHIKNIRNKTSEAHKQGLANPYKILGAIARNNVLEIAIIATMLCLAFNFSLISFSSIFLGLIWVFLLFWSVFIFIIPALYFMSCDPLPPGISKIRQWKEEAEEGMREAFQKQPETVPVVDR